MANFKEGSYGSFAAFRQEDGKVLGKIKVGVKSAFPAAGGQDYRFFVEPISPVPQGYEDSLRVGFTGFMSRIGYDCNYFSSEKEAWQALSEEWGNQLVLFTPALRNNKYFVIDDVQKEAAPTLMDEGTRFYPVPVFSVDDSPAFDGDINKFCYHIAEGKPLPGLSKKYWDLNRLPPLVMASYKDPSGSRKKLYAVFAPLREDSFRKVAIGEGGAYFECAGRNDLGYALVDMTSPEISSRCIVCRTAPLCFVPENFFVYFRKEMKPVPSDYLIVPEAKRGVFPLLHGSGRVVPQGYGHVARQDRRQGYRNGGLYDQGPSYRAVPERMESAKLTGPADNEAPEPPLLGQGIRGAAPVGQKGLKPEDSAPAKPASKGDMRNEARLVKAEAKPDAKAVKPESPAPVVKKVEKPAAPAFTEKDLITRFGDRAKARGLLYDKEDLINFHISAKSSRLVILAGMSGSGKSGLVRLYVEALGLPKEQLAMIPVRPSWMDDSDLLGYLDMKNMVYRPADTGLTELLVEAGKHPDKLYIVCFDEMNLARAEHYFAQFISALEKEEQPVIRLYNPSLAPRIYNSQAYPAEIPVGKNVLFTGTVNVDESTYHFSDKILDRANVITLHQGKFADLLSLTKTDCEPYAEVAAKTFLGFGKENKGIGLTAEELSFLDALNEELQESGLQSGIGYRVARQMGRYLDNIPEGVDFSRGKGIDCQTVQRILTKLRGSAEQLKALVSLDEEGHLTGSAAAVLDKYKGLSDFHESRKVLIRKAKELKLYDYTI